MQIRTLGQSGIQATAVALGTWAIGGDSSWGPSQEESSIRTIHAAHDLGITLVDTAPAYGLGNSEEVVGKAIKGNRDKYIISTKCGLVWDQDEGFEHMARDGVVLRRELSPKSLRHQLEQSLTRLGTDYIDIFITHWQSMPPNFVPIEETMGALNDFIKEGKIRAIGISNVTPEQIEAYNACGPIALVQQKYSMLDRTCEEGVIPKCQELGIAFQAYSPLERGILTGKITMDSQAFGIAKKGIKWYEPENRKRIIAALEQFKPLCEKYHTSMASLVIAWTVARYPFINVLCGARKPEQIEDNVAGGSLVLEPEDARFMDEVVKVLL